MSDGFVYEALPMSTEAADAFPHVLPDEWRVQDVGGGFVNDEGRHSGYFYLNERRGLRCGLSLAKEQDGRSWLHLSLSHPDRLPTWSELVTAKEVFLGKERKAIQVLPARREWVNIHPYVLHLFACLAAEDVLPDFTRGTGQL